MKEIVLDFAAVAQTAQIDDQMVDFGVVGPGPRRALNFIANRRWLDNEQDRSPTVEQMYVHQGWPM